MTLAYTDCPCFAGISSRDLVLTFKHKVVVLFKLILLERRVLFFGSPVKPICSNILAVLSLFPGKFCNYFRLTYTVMHTFFK